MRVSTAIALVAFALGSHAQTNLPPVASGTDFAVGTNITINAPIATVWDVLMDWEHYADWNPFVRTQTLANEFFIPVPVVNRTLAAIEAAGSSLENKRVIFGVQIPPLPLPVNASTPSNLLHSQTSFENITAMEPDQHRMAWKQLMFPEAILATERWSALSSVGGQTLYESRIGIGGALSGILKGLFGEGLQESFDAQGVALKARVEGGLA
ncbi:hypothetical protein BDY19DRAFT_988135 [Irpex rosettiformis]|uniref:Uncharacterized protein n=1 Tax=Irpex rosettiformis TaxID=378272 RepID=A0ACB8UJ35_9APHY|nr:hypothetical protein BDY19DRAFT_988135 [Irpex rosettiformis]